MRTIQKLTLVLGICGLVLTFLYVTDFRTGQLVEKKRSSPDVDPRTVVAVAGSSPKVNPVRIATNFTRQGVFNV